MKSSPNNIFIPRRFARYINPQHAQTKELQNGRLAMLGVAGMCAQELVNGQGIVETIQDFF